MDTQGMHVKLGAMVLNSRASWYTCNKHVWINKLVTNYVFAVIRVSTINPFQHFKCVLEVMLSNFKTLQTARISSHCLTTTINMLLSKVLGL